MSVNSVWTSVKTELDKKIKSFSPFTLLIPTINGGQAWASCFTHIIHLILSKMPQREYNNLLFIDVEAEAQRDCH